MARRGYPRIKAWLPDGSAIHPVGREALTLILLVKKAGKGLRAYDFPGGPPFRLAAYICDLRNEFGLTIGTDYEKHGIGEHAVYTLHTTVVIELVDYGTGRAA